MQQILQENKENKRKKLSLGPVIPKVVMNLVLFRKV